eukprot:TRINITY_DN12441_c0_g4_i1.p1 TRINITY_DN12441_c0_g4~~TRINITY_DN12441_c0_g4_i1.p1  ORF type:complete len:305 (-),score=101.84 TRINITY_DN12441_c0_g4_i1:37-951(-)
MLLKETEFAGGVQLIIIGVPLVGIVEFFSPHPKTSWFVKDFRSLKTATESSQYLRYFLHVVNNYQEPDNKLILDSFVSHHLEKCKKKNCYVTTYSIKERFNKNRMTITKKIDLTAYIRKLYRKALNKFPFHASLRISYAFFMIEMIQDLAGARKQLERARLCNPPLDEDFIIFRYCRIIEEKLSESKYQGEVEIDRVSLLAYENYYRQCKKKMKEAAELHMEFWSRLNTPSLDLNRLMEVAGRIHRVVSEVEECWGLLQGINANLPKAVLKYAKFLRDILGDEEAETHVPVSYTHLTLPTTPYV